MINSEIRQLKKTIIAVVNANPLPIEIKRLVFAEIYNQINEEAEKMIFLEKKQEESKQEEKINE